MFFTRVFEMVFGFAFSHYMHPCTIFLTPTIPCSCLCFADCHISLATRRDGGPVWSFVQNHHSFGKGLGEGFLKLAGMMVLVVLLDSTAFESKMGRPVSKTDETYLCFPHHFISLWSTFEHFVTRPCHTYLSPPICARTTAQELT